VSTITEAESATIRGGHILCPSIVLCLLSRIFA